MLCKYIHIRLEGAKADAAWKVYKNLSKTNKKKKYYQTTNQSELRKIIDFHTKVWKNLSKSNENQYYQADMAKAGHADTLCCLKAQTIGKTKKIKETKDPSQKHSKTIENNQKKQKNQRSQQDVNKPPVTSYHQVAYYRGICWFSSKMYGI